MMCSSTGMNRTALVAAFGLIPDERKRRSVRLFGADSPMGEKFKKPPTDVRLPHPLLLRQLLLRSAGAVEPIGFLGSLAVCSASYSRFTPVGVKFTPPTRWTGTSPSTTQSPAAPDHWIARGITAL
jgi:hypothetical protein